MKQKLITPITQKAKQQQEDKTQLRSRRLCADYMQEIVSFNNPKKIKAIFVCVINKQQKFFVVVSLIS